MAWENRIVGYGEESPEQLLPNEMNWKVHPTSQQEAMESVLGEIGWLTTVIVNRRSGRLIDGHMRIILALRRGEATVPVVYVDLSENEERLAILTLDPIGSMAATDKEMLDECIRGANTTDPEIQQILSSIAEREGLYKGKGKKETADGNTGGSSEPGAGGTEPTNQSQFKYQQQFGVIVVVDSEFEQERVYTWLKGEGYACKVVCV